MQAQRSVKNTQSATMVLVLRNEVEKWSGEKGNTAILSMHLRTQAENEYLFILNSGDDDYD